MVWRCPSSVKPHGGPKSFQMKDFGSILADCCPQQHGVPTLCSLTNAGCDRPFTFTNLVRELPTGFVEVVITCVYFSFILVFFFFKCPLVSSEHSHTLPSDHLSILIDDRFISIYHPFSTGVSVSLTGLVYQEHRIHSLSRVKMPSVSSLAFKYM